MHKMYRICILEKLLDAKEISKNLLSYILIYVGIASAMTTSCNWSLAFVVTFTFQNLIDVVHNYGPFWIFAGICALGAVFALLILPETKGKTVEEIMRLFAD